MMSLQTLDRVSKWVVIFGTIITVGLVGLFTTGSQFGNLQAAVNSNTEHRLDTDAHMPFKEKIEVFVTRKEFDRIIQQLNRIEEKLESR
jgi:hypothetical protein